MSATATATLTGDTAPADPTPAVSDDQAPDGTFSRKQWHELNPRYRRQLERQGQTAERHNQGLPPPDKAPERDAPKDAPKDAPSGKADPKEDTLRADLERLLARIGLAVLMVDRFDGLVIVNQAAPAAEALVALAERQPSVRKALESVTTASDYVGVGTVAVSILAPILMHHRIVPPVPMLGTMLGVPAEALAVDPLQPDDPEPEPAEDGRTEAAVVYPEGEAAA